MAISDAEVFREPTEILPMGGGYDWRCFTGHGPYFLCKDGLPLRDSSEWNTHGWRVSAVEIGQDAAITKFAVHVHGLERRLADAVEILKGLGIGKSYYHAGEVLEATKRAEAFVREHEQGEV